MSAQHPTAFSSMQYTTNLTPHPSDIHPVFREAYAFQCWLSQEPHEPS